MVIRRGLTITSAALLLVLVVSACSGADDEPVAEPSTTASASAEPTPEPTPLALSDLVVSAAGLGPVLVGETVAGSSDVAALMTWDETGCSSTDEPRTAGEPFAGRWESVFSSSPDDRDFQVVTSDGLESGAVSRIVVESPDISTSEGIRVGSTRDEVVAAFPDAAVLGEPGTSTVYAVEGTSGTMAIEVATDFADLPGYWAPEEIDTVRWIVVTDSATEARPIAGTDGAGSCPV